MNILFVTHYASLYGANRSLLALFDGLNSHEIKPYVIVPNNGELIKELKARDIDFYIYPFKSWMSLTRYKAPLRFIENVIALPFLVLKIRKWDIKHIHTNSSVTPIGAWLAYITKLPHTWHIREFGWDDYQLKYDLGRKQFEYWLNKAEHIISVSNSIQKKVLKNVNVPNSIIYNGVISRIEAVKINSNSLESRKKKVFGIIGNLNPSKGQDQAIKAFAQITKLHSDIELRIAGTGSENYEVYLKKLCHDLKVSEQVHFMGYVSNPFEFYENIDVALICSKNEGMGRVTAEAMVAGKIIIGLDNAGTSELIEDGVTGFLYKDNVQLLAEKMKYVICNNVSNVAIKAREKGVENFLNEEYARKVKKVIFKNV